MVSGPAVMISSVGRKVSLVAMLTDATRQFADFRLLTADLDPYAPGHRVGMGRVDLPPLHSLSEFPPNLLPLLRDAGVGVVVPTRDGELEFWATNAETLRASGIDVVVSPAATIRVMLDKLSFAEGGAAVGLPVIPTSLLPDFDGPLVVKERYGAGSRSIALGVSSGEARAHSRGLAAPVFQPFIQGSEFSADAWVGRSGTLHGPILRRRETVVDGEATVTTTLRDADLERTALSVLTWLPLRGPVNVQLLRTTDGTVHVLEVNARFGGASTCSVHAGLDVWNWELREYLGEDAGPFQRLQREVRQVRLRQSDGGVKDRIEYVGAAE